MAAFELWILSPNFSPECVDLANLLLSKHADVSCIWKLLCRIQGFDAKSPSCPCSGEAAPVGA